MKFRDEEEIRNTQKKKQLAIQGKFMAILNIRLTGL